MLGIRCCRLCEFLEMEHRVCFRRKTLAPCAWHKSHSNIADFLWDETFFCNDQNWPFSRIFSNNRQVPENESLSVSKLYSGFEPLTTWDSILWICCKLSLQNGIISILLRNRGHTTESKKLEWIKISIWLERLPILDSSGLHLQCFKNNSIYAMVYWMFTSLFQCIM